MLTWNKIGVCLNNLAMTTLVAVVGCTLLSFCALMLRIVIYAWFGASWCSL